MSAFTFSRDTDTEVGRQIAVDHKGYRRVRGTLTGPTSYDTGGSALPRLEVRHIFDLHVLTDVADADVDGDGNQLQVVEGDPGSVKVFDSTNTEVASATDLSASTWKVEVIGK